MSEQGLIATPALGNVRLEMDGLLVEEISNHALYSIAMADNAKPAVSKKLLSAYAIETPEIGQFSEAAGLQLLGLQQDQWFLLCEDGQSHPINALFDTLGNSAYLSDQSDSWVIITVAGVHAQAVLERICPLDLHTSAFAPGSVVRTIMEHLATIIMCVDTDSYLLLSPRSSAQSFFHAVETSVSNVM